MWNGFPYVPRLRQDWALLARRCKLVGDPQHPRLVTIKSGIDHTRALETMTTNRIEELKKLDLSGYVFKKGSPSCGIERVRIYNEHGMPSRNGVGLFARAFIEQFPLIPVEEEGRLCDPTAQGEFYRAGLLLPSLAGSRSERSHEAGPGAVPYDPQISCCWPITHSNARCSDG